MSIVEMCYQLSSTKVYAQSVIDWTVVDRSTKLTIPANSDARPTAVVYHSNRHALSTTRFRLTGLLATDS